MNAEDFQELYKLLRGSKSAMPVLDAKALYVERKMVASLDKLVTAKETFLESRSRLLNQDVEQQVDKKAKDADRQIKKLKRKQEKLLDIVKAFDELVASLEKFAERERERQSKANEAAAAEAEQTRQRERAEDLARRVARSKDLSQEFRDAFANASNDDDRLDLVAAEFGFEQIESDSELLGDCLYLIRTGDSSYLVCTPAEDQLSETVAVMDVVAGRPIKPFSRNEFLKLGKRRKMVLLTRNEAAAGDVRGVEPDSSNSSPSADRVPAESENPETNQVEAGSVDGDSVESADKNVLDMGAFSQLLSSAQRSGLLPSADQIGFVRDREFRKGHYDRAFQAIDGMYRQLMSAAGQRTQRLAREDAEIAAGRIKISPKDLQAKRSRDRVQTQEIERTKRRFQVVLEGLRVLQSKPEVSEEHSATP